MTVKRRKYLTDPKQFNDAVAAIVELEGGIRKAAAAFARRSTPVSPQFFVRWGNRGRLPRQRSVSPDKYSALMSYCDAEAKKRAKGSRKRAIARSARTAFIASVAPPPGEDRWNEYAEWASQRLASFGPRHAKAFKALAADAERWIDGAFRNCVGRFRGEMQARGHEQRRIDLAVWRVLDPLLDYAFTGGVERNLLAEARVRVFAARNRPRAKCEQVVNRGLERERILLERPPAAEAAQAAKGATRIAYRTTDGILVIGKSAPAHRAAIRRRAMELYFATTPKDGGVSRP